MCHSFSDDTQIYSRLSIRDKPRLDLQLQNMQNCLEDIRNWMVVNKLKLNDSKTEILVITSRHNSKYTESIRIQIGEETIIPKQTARNLGAHLDNHLSMLNQVNSVTRSMYFNLRRISKIKPCLTPDACTKAINTTVLSRLDYHNGLLLGVPETSLKKLQVAQNNAARLLTGTTRREHITPVLRQLHWLPVKQRVAHKTLTLVQKSLHADTAPQYMRDLCTIYQPTRTLRSSADQWKLVVPRAKNNFGARSFKTLGAQLWNNLPQELRAPASQAAFRKHLKTFLFIEAYGQ